MEPDQGEVIHIVGVWSAGPGSHPYWKPGGPSPWEATHAVSTQIWNSEVNRQCDMSGPLDEPEKRDYMIQLTFKDLSLTAGEGPEGDKDGRKGPLGGCKILCIF